MGLKSAIQTQIAIQIQKTNNVDKPMVNNDEINYFLPGHSQNNDKRASAVLTQQLH